MSPFTLLKEALPRLRRGWLARLRTSRLFSPLAARIGRDPRAEAAGNLLHAAEIARSGGHRSETLTLYGRAIDAYLEAGLDWEAEQVCRRLIEVEPEVIRTRYTLAMLAVGRDDLKAARTRLGDYIAAVMRAQAAGMAVSSLLEMAAATANPAMRRLIAECLREVGVPEIAYRVQHGTAAPASATSWARAVGGALKRPTDVDVGALTAP